MEKIKINRLFLTLLMVSLIIVSCFSIRTVKANPTYPFDSTNVLEDLESVEGFDILEYPYGNYSARVVSFVEWCYSTDREKKDNYALYVYFYNPKNLDIDCSSSFNKIQMAVAYDKYPITDVSSPTKYEKFNLVFCNKSTRQGYEGLFYKFRIVDHVTDNLTIQERVNSNKRRYDVSGIELVENGKYTATEYGVNSTYTFTGFSKGFGPDGNAESSLKAEVKQLETVSLDVKHTYWRSKTSSKGANYQNQLDTVYFSVPKRLLQTYGKLQRIKAEWYEYYTKDIVVTNNKEFYEKAVSYVGTSMNFVHNESLVYGLGQNAGDAGGGMSVAEWGWNLGTYYLHLAEDRLFYLFPTENWCPIEEYDPYGHVTKTGGITSNMLYDYIKAYNKTYETGTVKDGKISADLFEKTIPDERKMNNSQGKVQYGYSYYDFDADIDTQSWLSYSETEHSFWENWMNYGFWKAITGSLPQETGAKLCPIYILEAKDLSGTDKEISDRLYVNVNDVLELKTTYNAATTITGVDDEERVVVLFRFAQSDYYSAPLDLIDIDGGFLWNDKKISGQAYRAKESVFLDFDIIELTFNKEGKCTVMPVVSNPIDIVNDVTSPTVIENEDWWKQVLSIILFLLLLFILLVTGILPLFIKGIIWIIMLPVKAVILLVRTIFKER